MQSCLVETILHADFEAIRAHGFYLNKDPAQCDGTVTEFKFYRSNLGIAASYDFTFAVFSSSHGIHVY